MFNHKLMELESELLAKQQCAGGLLDLPYECELCLQSIEQEVGIKLGSPTPKDWKGWLSYRRKDASDSQGGKSNCGLVVLRGRACSEGGMFAKWKAGLDVPFAVDTVTEFKRGFDVTPPQDLDHLLINFGRGKSTRVFVWYGENIAPYRLIFEADVDEDHDAPLKEALTEACVWIMTRPKETTLAEFLKGLSG
ncbi:MAG: hypothetical protein IT342_07255 [Candidatus Melainabacteria bacterium]|nr:hypothetical protein [Candidatus Melainabacteria bacterium]